MQRQKMTIHNERQLVGQVLKSLGLPHIAESDRFFRYFHSVANLRYASHRQCRAYVGGQAQRRSLLTAIDLGRWVQQAPRPILGEVTASSQLGQALMDDLRYLQQERVEVLVLDAKHRIIDRQTVFQGTLDSCPVHPREIFQLAVINGAAAIVVAHNHPSGVPQPSTNDLAFMRRLADCGRLMGIPLLDGFVVGIHSYFSLREAGQLPANGKENAAEPLKTD
ncbi:JAB domain-containing protein [Levilactobacillus angrenensis]|uniref:RadC family protein n=1 Tax=Levilactobacillus angrenensis TaxID=2486020 RepID=A0ABW1UDL3_9LACO|nr:JAB domain-containing protein [Levilactobacillus angrenensis]